mgnify:CR=1 FL=1
MSLPQTMPSVDVADEGQQSLIKRITSLQSVWILGVLLVIVAFFTVTAGGKFFSASNFSLISQNIAVWAVLGVGMTFVIITSGIDLSVGSVLVFSSVVAAKVMEGSAATAGDCCHRHSGRARHRSPLGIVEWILGSQGEDPAPDCHAGNALDSPRAGSGDHRWY